MKCAVFAILLLTAVSARAQESPGKEPAALVKLRKAYEAKVKAAVDPITAAYLKKLDEMKKSYGAEGDLESAQAVQKEIESLTTNKPKSAVTIAGTWSWGNAIVKFQDDGSGTYDADGRGQGLTSGRWKCLDKKKRTYQVSWSTGSVDLMLLSPEGDTMICRNTKSDKSYTSRRVPIDEQK